MLGTQNAEYGTCCLPTGVALYKSMGRRPIVFGTADAEQRLLQNNKSCPEKEGMQGMWCVVIFSVSFLKDAKHKLQNVLV